MRIDLLSMMFASRGIRNSVVTAIIFLLLASSNFAQVPPAALTATGDVSHDTQRWIEQAVAAADVPHAANPLRMEVTVGSLDTRLRLAPCARVEPYIPAGIRLWGKSRVGLRCLEGVARWSVFLPVTVKAMGRAWVLQSNLSAGSVLTRADAVESEVDWAEEASPVLTDPSAWVGLLASRSLSAGQTLRQSAVRAPAAFTAGAQVRLIAQGMGFNVSTDAQALGAGVVGQMVRLRMDDGRIVSGMVVDARTVKMDL